MEFVTLESPWRLFGSTDGRRAALYAIWTFSLQLLSYFSSFLTRLKELSVCVFLFSHLPLHSGFCLHRFLAMSVQKISEIHKSPVPCNLCTHLYLAPEQCWPLCSFFDLPGAIVPFPPVPLVTTSQTLFWLLFFH